MTAPCLGTLPLYEELARAGLHHSPLRPGGLALTARAVSHCRFPENAGLLDLGCGNGATVEHLRTHWGLAAVGVEPSSFLIGLGSHRGKDLMFVRATGEHLPFPADTWDGILLECVLSAAGDIDAVIAECARVLKHGGHLIVTDIYRRPPAGLRHPENVRGACCLSGALEMDDFLDRLGQMGFAAVLWEDHSRALGEFAAELILADIPFDPAGFRPMGRGATDGAASLSPPGPTQGKPGYFLLVARLIGPGKTEIL